MRAMPSSIAKTTICSRAIDLYLFVKEFKQRVVYFRDGLVLHPMTAIRNSQLAVGRRHKSFQIADCRRNHGHVQLAVDEKRGHSNAFVTRDRRLRAAAKKS